MISERRFPTKQDCLQACSEAIVSCLADSLKNKNQAKLVVSGGRTAKKLLPYLAAANLDWTKIGIGLTDERCVPMDHEERNERLVKTCFEKNGVSLIGLTGLVDEQGNFKSFEKNASRSTVTFLGMGEDGHIASLFPSGGLELINSYPCVGTKSPFGVVDRVSLSHEHC